MYIHPLEESHISLAHTLWKKHVCLGDCVVDATCGNGHDTLFLSRLALKEDCGWVIGLDVQQVAIDQTFSRLRDSLSESQKNRVQLFCQSHATFPSLPVAPSLIVYNLGYLPGSDKKMTTLSQTTIISVKNALNCVAAGGVVSITCYPGHLEGGEELRELSIFLNKLSADDYHVAYYVKKERLRAPSLFIIKNIKN